MTQPFFVTADQAREAFEAFVLPGIIRAIQGEHVNRPHLHVTVLNPHIPYTEGAELPIWFEHSIGKRSDWENWGGRSFDDFARGKSSLTWRTGFSSREVVLCHPHLLRTGDCHLWGSAIIDGLICGVSGVQPYFDEMFARMTCAAIIAEASHYQAEYSENPDAEDFL